MASGCGVVMRKGSSPGDIAVLLVVDSELFTTGLVLALSTRQHLHIVAVARNNGDANDAVARLEPDFVLIESEMARRLAQRTAANDWRAKIVVLGRNDHIGVDPPVDRQLLCGFLSYGASSRDCLAVIDTVTGCPRRQAATSAACSRCVVRRTLAPQPLDLTARELQVFSLTGRGFRSGNIAKTLGVSTKTIDAHRESIKHKLGLDSARALNVVAARWCHGENVRANGRDDAGERSA